MAITFAPDESAKEPAEMVGAEKLIDKMDLVENLIPTILGTSESQRSGAQAPQNPSARSEAMPE